VSRLVSRGEPRPGRTLARNVLGYEPAVTLEDGLSELAEWLSDRTAHDHVADARQELAARELTV